ncbi:MAG: ATP-binding cassette domain-containing protein [Oscillospiraceae bacterium]|nr:ATP-binding cassette domain-containing protein [Oscillospiraceae bacterium]
MRKRNKSFGEKDNRTQVLHDVSLTIGKGEFISLMGASGSDKSTLLYLLGELDTPDNGTVQPHQPGEGHHDPHGHTLCRMRRPLRQDRYPLRRTDPGDPSHTKRLAAPPSTAILSVVIGMPYSLPTASRSTRSISSRRCASA